MSISPKSKMTVLIAAIILAIGAVAFMTIVPGNSRTKPLKALADRSEIAQNRGPAVKPHFPTIEGQNIDGRPFKLPDDFEGLYNIVFIAYSQQHQSDVDEWMPHARDLAAAFPDIQVYELPVVREMAWFMREQLGYWMSNGISDSLARATTITLYTDVQTFNQDLNFPDTDEIGIALVDRFGNVVWRERGECAKAKLNHLENSIVNLLANIRIAAPG